MGANVIDPLLHHIEYLRTARYAHYHICVYLHSIARIEVILYLLQRRHFKHNY